MSRPIVSEMLRGRGQKGGWLCEGEVKGVIKEEREGGRMTMRRKIGW